MGLDWPRSRVTNFNFEMRFLFAFVLAACFLALASALPGSDSAAQQEYKEYIIMFDDDATMERELPALVEKYGVQIQDRYEIIPGASVRVPVNSASAFTSLSSTPGIQSIEENQIMHTMSEDV